MCKVMHCIKDKTVCLQSGNPIQQTRGIAIKCLIDHLGEEPGDLIKDFEVSRLKYFNNL